MSLLWKAEEKEILQNKRKNSKNLHLKPSPIKANWLLFLKSFARGSDASIEGTSLFIFLQKKVSASMAVEAAIVLPLFLFFFLNLSCALEMIRLQSNLELALQETGNKMSIYGHILSSGSSKKTDDEQRENNDAKDGLFSELEDIAFSYLYIKKAIIQYAGEEYLEQSPLTYGANGLQFIESEIFTSEDCFEIIMTYEVSSWMGMPGMTPFRMWNRYYGHIWNGYEIPVMSSQGEDAGEIVYVAKNGKVYHKDKNCTHLHLTIREVSIMQVGNERNENGGRYYLCEKCGKGAAPIMVFIGAEGERFHYDRTCSGLKRTVFSIFLQDAKAYRPCSRCSSYNKGKE